VRRKNIKKGFNMKIKQWFEKSLQLRTLSFIKLGFNIYSDVVTYFNIRMFLLIFYLITAGKQICCE